MNTAPYYRPEPCLHEDAEDGTVDWDDNGSWSESERLHDLCFDWLDLLDRNNPTVYPARWPAKRNHNS